MAASSNQHVAASVVLADRDTILLLRAADQMQWNLPTAAVATGETVQQAGQRAVLAATGIAVALTNLVGIYTTAHADAPTALRFVFSAYTTPGRVRAGEHVAELRWVPLDELDELSDDQLVQAAALRRISADLRRGMRFPLGVLVEPNQP